MTQTAYCTKHRLSLASFGYRRKQLAVNTMVLPAIIPMMREAIVAKVQLHSPGGGQIALPAALERAELMPLLALLA